jgi:capsular polysaccharide biosynthesis protein
VVGAGSGHGKKIYLSRMGMRRRPLSNEAELQAALEAEGFTTIRMEELDGVGQLAVIQGADVIVAPHGGALTSLFAARPGSRCIEMFHPHKGTTAFAMIAARRGLNYAPVFGEPQTGDAWRIDVPKVLAATRGD